MSELASAISALNNSAVADYQIIGEGQTASVTLGPGGATILQTGAAVWQTSGAYILGIVAFVVLAWLIFRRK